MNYSFDNFVKEGLHEECGVFGIFSDGSLDPAYACYNGLLALQHRGQESCGIAVSDEGVIDYHKNMGLVTEVFNNSILDSLRGQMGISHVRYSTAGGSVLENAQPLVMRYVKGTLSVAHNGNLTNAVEIRRELEHKGAIFQTTIDSEVICYLIARARLNCHSVEEAVAQTMTHIKGAYSLLVMSPRKLIAARDPHGFRPLCMGKLNGTYVFASESAALDACGAEFVRDVDPGEIVIVDNKGLRTMKPDFGEKKKSLCIFEYIYFARSDSFIDGVSVYEARKQAGRILAREFPVEADMVIGVPESGIDAAIGYAEESGIPYEKAIVKNSYIGRTFIKPSQSERMKSVRIKLNPIADMVRGKRVVMIDDSIVRGTTVDRIVTMLRDAGAKEVHMRISSPPFMWPCYYGTDIPSRGELIACNHTIEEITKLSGADSLGYLPVESLHEMIGYAPVGFCQGCFTGDYPADIIRETLEGKERGGMNFDSKCIGKEQENE
ncbi:MAG: amidophosphoribosyltransferase [Ruminococcus sp.]|nr:amidophosphoribosyltransferase [uncultured Ruminococcus sp.]MBQ1354052.1 amidophosphoribosyltransferase [Ruminococcus sp.]MBQ2279981.1 amidophosphoribosyltransferase [Ruminococcus sp.]MBQ5764366.1 amidophosphoribosyltransferase [Ruminococcus sp.]MDO4892059.1 amidophosphoribosyltransferase [Eubacteriales bacterium]